MTEITEKNLAEELAKISPDMSRLVQEHLAINEETIPTILFGDVAGYVEVMWKAHEQRNPSEPNAEHKVRQIFNFIERSATSSDRLLVDAVTLSFLEMICPSEPYYKDYLGMLGPQSMDRWTKYVGALLSNRNETHADS